MHKNATKCNETLSKWCKNKHGASKIIDTFETYQWCWSKDGVYSVMLAYNAFFVARTRYTMIYQIWCSRAPYGCKFFAWIISKLHGLPRPVTCPLCDQVPETIQHLLLRCVVARQVWVWALNLWDMLAWLPLQTPSSFGGGPLDLVPRRRSGTFGPLSFWSSGASSDTTTMWFSTKLGLT
jgi:hypothetical protein